MNQPLYPGPQPSQPYPYQGYPTQQPGFPGQFAPRSTGDGKGLALAGVLCVVPYLLYSLVSTVYWVIAHDSLINGSYLAVTIAEVVLGIPALVLGGIALAKARRSSQPFMAATLGGAAALQGAIMVVFGALNLVSYLINGY